MKILILEDNLIRLDKFRQLFKNQEICICQDVESAKEACIDNILNPFQALWLDHDLNGRIWEDSQEKIRDTNL